MIDEAEMTQLMCLCLTGEMWRCL